MVAGQPVAVHAPARKSPGAPVTAGGRNRAVPGAGRKVACRSRVTKKSVTRPCGPPATCTWLYGPRGTDGLRPGSAPGAVAVDRTGHAGLASGQYLAGLRCRPPTTWSTPGRGATRAAAAADRDLLPAARTAGVTDFFVTRETARHLPAGPGYGPVPATGGDRAPGLFLAGA